MIYDDLCRLSKLAGFNLPHFRRDEGMVFVHTFGRSAKDTLHRLETFVGGARDSRDSRGFGMTKSSRLSRIGRIHASIAMVFE